MISIRENLKSGDKAKCAKCGLTVIYDGKRWTHEELLPIFRNHLALFVEMLPVAEPAERGL